MSSNRDTLFGYPIVWNQEQGEMSESEVAEQLSKLGTEFPEQDGSLKYFPLREIPGLDSELRVTLECSEFACRCPATGQVDQAKLVIKYVPGTRGVERKSLELYLEIFRDEKILPEHLVVRILRDFIASIEPRTVSVMAYFDSRGGIAISVAATQETRMKWLDWARRYGDNAEVQEVDVVWRDFHHE